MAAIETPIAGTRKGWLAGIFGLATPTAPPSAQRRRGQRTFTAHPAVAELVAGQTEQRARDATSGFEMGEFEPHARRG
jgi:hypothetical protein